jgi:hypothetical protein
MYDTKPLANTHDLRLPDWGPYTKKYNGISHLPDPKSGLRFDLSVFPGYYRRQVLVPNAKWESGFHPWEAAPDLSYFAYRYELEWKDRVYCDVSFSALDGNTRLVRSAFFNNTAQRQNLVLNYAAYMNFPPARTYSDEPVYPNRVELPPGARWLDALDYDDLGFATVRPQDNLVYDGMWRGEVRANGFVNGAGLGIGFGRQAGDWVKYTFDLDQALPAALLLVRYRALEGSAAFHLSGLAAGQMELPASAEFSLAQVWQGELPAGKQPLGLEALGGTAVELDGFVLVAPETASEVRFTPVEWQPKPQILPGPRPNSLILKYADTPVVYGLAWTGEPWVLREFYNDELDRFMRYYVQEHAQNVLHGTGQGHFTNVFIRPIEVPPGESRVLYGLICSGTQGGVTQTLGEFSGEDSVLGPAYQHARAITVRLEPTPAGDGYRFSQERMAATLLTNVVYPVYTRRTFIRHNTPGKWWDCLYTWDAGFIGLGLLELDVERAVDCLNAYTTAEGDPQVAFMHHGSMVPVQHYLFQELWNRTQDRGLLEYFYPRLRQYYRFFAGRLGSSTTRAMKSNLLKTWDYFYNSGGWDDYPPQVQVHRERLEATTTPVISTAHGIRIAKILQMAARAAGQSADVAEYQADIQAWTNALQRFSWDPEAGYFSYVLHNEQGEPSGILRHAGGQNYDMGLDGASPFFAGACTSDQEAILLERLSSPQRMWTPIGLCTVDKTAAYYKVDGYWNGAVWFPQQWFFWKALLDQGQADFAAQIARTALDTWKREVDDSYHCFEHFIVQSGRGAGWHQFGGLSTPVLSWYGAYHRPGRLTVGFDTWIQREQFSVGNRRLEAELDYQSASPRPFTVLVGMASGPSYRATWNGKPVSYHERYPGLLEITLPGQPTNGRLVVQELKKAP